MNENYTVYHLHSDISNLTAGTSADSVTKYTDYIERASELGMNAMAISEHGSVINWIKKKTSIEKAGMKYIHANEVYLTETISSENGLIRDNYHYMLIAKNYDGVLELNTLTSNSFNREDGHFYYNPRITFDELKNTSDNILMTSACLASPLWRMYKMIQLHKGTPQEKEWQRKLDDLLNWMAENRHRMFFEIQYHQNDEQIEFNQMLLRYSRELNIPLIAGSDTHALNQEQAEVRQLYMKAKGVDYGYENQADLTFKSYPEFVEMFKKQGALAKNVYLEAIENTNVMANMIEEFKLDKTPKYPKLYDEPLEVFKQKINEGIKKRGIDKFPDKKRKQYLDRIKEEIETYIKLDTIDYMLLQKNIIDWCQSKEIYHGYGRGSVTGSLIAYVLGITEMDSIKYKLNFFRFLNPERISLPDIDIDFPPSRRQEVIDYLSSLEGIDFAEIITLNTVALKGSIREVGRGMGMDLDVVDTIAKAVEVVGGDSHIKPKWKKQYPELFHNVDILKGTIVSMGSHPSGFAVSPIDLASSVSTIFTKESKYRVTAVNMKELDGENYVKLDILGLANIELINDVCKLVGIPRLTPDNIDTKDMNVWKSLRESTLGVFQWESDSASAYVKQLFSDETINRIKQSVGDDVDYIEILSFANGAIRPSGDSYRQDLAKGIVKDNGHPALNESLKDTLGFLVYQEQIMRFLTDFCEHSGAESDSVRRGLSKKEGTEQFLPKIEEGFIHNMTTKYNTPVERAKEILQSFLQVIKDASKYGFSINHSSPYSFTGYAGAWLRYYYPLQFLTVVLNVMKDEKVSKIMAFAKKKGYEIKPVTFGQSRAYYSYNEEELNVYKGIASIKFLNAQVAEELYELAQNKEYTDWIDLLVDIYDTSINTRQLEILIRIDFFRQFGEKEVLLEVFQCMYDKKKADFDKYPEFADKFITEKKKKRNGSIEIKEKTIKRPLKYDSTHNPKTIAQRLENIRAYYDAVLANPPAKIEFHEQIAYEKENLGYGYTTIPDANKDYVLVADIQNMQYTPKLVLYQLKSGKETIMKFNKKDFWFDDKQNLFVGDVVEIVKCGKEQGWTKNNGKWERNPAILEWHLYQCRLIEESPKRNEIVHVDDNVS